MQVILGDDLVEDQVEGNFHVLIPMHGCVVIEILNVQSEETSTWGRNGAVQEALGGSQTGTVCCCNSRKLELVAAHFNANTMCLRFVGADTCNKSRVSDCPTSGNI